MTSTKCMESMELRQASQSITGQRVGSGSQSLTNPSTRDHNYGSSKTRPSLNPNESRLPNTTVVSSSSLITPAAPKRAMYTPPHLRRKNAENDVSGTSPPSAASLSRSPPRGNNDASLSRSPPRGNNNASLSRSPPRGNNIASLSRSPPRGNNDASLSRSPPRGNDFRAQNQSNGNNHASRAGVKRDHSPPQQRRQPPEPVAPARRRPTAWLQFAATGTVTKPVVPPSTTVKNENAQPVAATPTVKVPTPATTPAPAPAAKIKPATSPIPPAVTPRPAETLTKNAKAVQPTVSSTSPVKQNIPPATASLTVPANPSSATKPAVTPSPPKAKATAPAGHWADDDEDFDYNSDISWGRGKQ